MKNINPQQLVHEVYQCVQETSENLYRPFILLLHSQLADALEPQERIVVLNDICDHHVEYLRPFGLPDSQLGSIFLECKSLIHYNEIIASLLEKPANRSTLQCNKHISRPRLEQYIYMQSLRELDIRHYVAFIQGYALYSCKQVKDPNVHIPVLSMAMLQTWNCLDQMYSKNIISFCKHLYFGESVRQHEIGLLGDDGYMDIHTFDVAFRNRCFDEYIRIRLNAIKAKVDADNDRLYPPTETDYLNELLQEESAIVNKELTLENEFPNSQAFHDQNDLSRPDVMKMAGYFVRYLSDKIGLPATPQSTVIQPVSTRQTLSLPLTWQQILTDYAVPDEKCKESYGWHNVRIAMYIKALEEVHLLHVCDRQGTNAVSFYQTLTDIFHFPVIQNSIETQINHLHENERNKNIYLTEILPLIKSLTKAA